MVTNPATSQRQFPWRAGRTLADVWADSDIAVAKNTPKDGGALPSKAQLEWLQSALNNTGHSVYPYTATGSRTRQDTMMACHNRGWVVLWFRNMITPGADIYKLTVEGEAVARHGAFRKS